MGSGRVCLSLQIQLQPFKAIHDGTTDVRGTDLIKISVRWLYFVQKSSVREILFCIFFFKHFRARCGPSGDLYLWVYGYTIPLI